MKKAVFISILFSVLFLFGEDVVQKVDDGSINWTEMTVTVTGSGIPDLGISNVSSAKLSAEKTAKMNAVYRFLKALEKIELCNGKDLEKYLAEIKDGSFIKELGRNVQWSEMSLDKQYSDGSVDFSFKFHFEQQLIDIIKKTQSAFVKAPVAAIDSSNIIPAEKRAGFLVIDLKGHKMSPVLFPSVETSDGEILFNITKVNDGFSQPGGFYRVRKTADSILEKFNAKEDFLSISASKIKDRSVIIISRDDAVKIKTMLKPEVFSEGRIVVIFQ
ncbi:MAG TPA: hypothetical protein PKG52_09300 [bacterium]|nr:hypothetical protein [bacterium]HPS29449.1 hypothetical protein [bacterium]